MQREDRGPNVLDRLVETVHGAHDASGHLGVVDQADCALQRHSGREQTLDHQVVQVPRDALPFLERAEACDVAAPLGQLEGDGGLQGELDDDRDGLGRERWRTVLTPQPEHAADRTGGAHRRGEVGTARQQRPPLPGAARVVGESLGDRRQSGLEREIGQGGAGGGLGVVEALGAVPDGELDPQRAVRPGSSTATSSASAISLPGPRPG